MFLPNLRLFSRMEPLKVAFGNILFFKAHFDSICFRLIEIEDF